MVPTAQLKPPELEDKEFRMGFVSLPDVPLLCDLRYVA